ncbi:MAG: hypothetical protein PHF70_10680, partial [Opitutales bacterium]|nr:hypothetical protein [Opitutales bacterium]
MPMRNLLRSLILLFVPVILFAGGTVRFVETTVDLQADGRAKVHTLVQWKVLGGSMHAFYFAGTDRLQVAMDSDAGYAVDSDGKRYPLRIDPMGRGKWDIQLANGQRSTAETLTYSFSFATDFAAAEYVGPTRSNEGRDLVYFHWAPPEWDEAWEQEHATVRVVLPVQVPEGQNARDWVNANEILLTEKWMNERYKLDYQREEGSDRLVLVAHRENPGNKASMKLQFYVPADSFALVMPDHSGTRRSILWGGAVLIGLFALVLRGKKHSIRKARRSVGEVKWSGIDWTPPKLKLSTF